MNVQTSTSGITSLHNSNRPVLPVKTGNEINNKGTITRDNVSLEGPAETMGLFRNLRQDKRYKMTESSSKME